MNAVGIALRMARAKREEAAAVSVIYKPQDSTTRLNAIILAARIAFAEEIIAYYLPVDETQDEIRRMARSRPK